MVAETAEKTRAEARREEQNGNSNHFTLTVFERLALLNIIPSTTDLHRLGILRRLKEALEPSEADLKAIDFLPLEGGQIQYNPEKAEKATKTVVIGVQGKALVVDGIQAAGKAKALHPSHMDLYARFIQIPDGEEEDES